MYGQEAQAGEWGTGGALSRRPVGLCMVKRNVPAGGKVYSYYICSKNAATKECGAHRIPKEKLESLVFEVLKTHIANVLDTGRILEYIDTVPFPT